LNRTSATLVGSIVIVSVASLAWVATKAQTPASMAVDDYSKPKEVFSKDLGNGASLKLVRSPYKLGEKTSLCYTLTFRDSYRPDGAEVLTRKSGQDINDKDLAERRGDAVIKVFDAAVRDDRLLVVVAEGVFIRVLVEDLATMIPRQVTDHRLLRMSTADATELRQAKFLVGMVGVQVWMELVGGQTELWTVTDKTAERNWSSRPEYPTAAEEEKARSRPTSEKAASP
jgi:hypothetical protein